MSSEWSHLANKESLRELYAQVNPKKSSDDYIERLLKQYEGKEGELVAKLQERYGAAFLEWKKIRELNKENPVQITKKNKVVTTKDASTQTTEWKERTKAGNKPSVLVMLAVFFFVAISRVPTKQAPPAVIVEREVPYVPLLAAPPPPAPRKPRAFRETLRQHFRVLEMEIVE